MEDDLAQWIVALLSIWVSPRDTIRKIVDANPRKFVTGIGWTTGAFGALVFEVWASNSAAATSLPKWAVDMGPVTLAMSAFTLGLAGVGNIYVLAWIFRGVGSLLGGTGDLIEVRAAVAWSWVPLPMVGVVAVIASASTPTANSWAAPTTPDPFQIPYSTMAEAGLTLWALIIMMQTLGEVQRLSPRRAAGMLGLGTVAITLVAACGFIIITGLAMLVGKIV